MSLPAEPHPATSEAAIRSGIAARATRTTECLRFMKPKARTLVLPLRRPVERKMTPDYRDDTEAAAEPDAPWSDEPERRETLVPENLHGARLDKALVTLVEGASRARVKKAIESGECSAP